MGFGDDIMAIGEARELWKATGKKVFIGRSPQKFVPSKMYWNVPYIGDDGEVFLKSRSGDRPYITRRHGSHIEVDPDYRAKPGELVFSPDERRMGDQAMGRERAVILEPHVKGRFSGANKLWPWERWQELADRLEGHRLVQVSEPRHEKTLRGVERISLGDVRQALSCLRYAWPVITSDGLFHHAAAALNVPAVVLWGSRVNPEVLGYPDHTNLASYEGRWCGSVAPCEHCTRAMARITVDAVLEAVEALL